MGGVSSRIEDDVLSRYRPIDEIVVPNIIVNDFDSVRVAFDGCTNLPNLTELHTQSPKPTGTISTRNEYKSCG